MQLVVTQVASLSLLLLIGAGPFFLRSLKNLSNLGPGWFSAERLVGFNIDSVAERLHSRTTETVFYQQLTENLNAIPGVKIGGRWRPCAIMEDKRVGD